ncbi:MAG: lytic transglycosylase domain-containing protein [bacterium]|nr:lytic transglycosylase domain-containing protein [bacterium]
MKTNTFNATIISVLALSMAVLMVTVITMNNERSENLEIMTQLSKQGGNLEKEVASHEKYRNEESQRLAFADFKENVFRLRFPRFAKIAKNVYDKSKELKFNPYLTMAIIQVESGFDPYAVSTAGAYGLMQVNYSVWKNALDIDYNRIFEKEYNIELGLRVLRHYLNKSGGNIFRALFRYNNGYKHNNTAYNGKIAATRFFAHRNKIKDEKKTIAKDTLL